MRLPWAIFEDIMGIFVAGAPCAALGSLSAEERCTTLPEKLRDLKPGSPITLLEIRDPVDACPDYSSAIAQKVSINRSYLNNAAIAFTETNCQLLATEDELEEAYRTWKSRSLGAVAILDITSLPKRYFCYFLKLMMQDSGFENVIVTYGEASHDGYAPGHLAEDPMQSDHLPGFAAPLPPRGSTFVVAVGFESLSLQSLLEVYRDKRKRTKILLSFPPGLMSIRRQWNTLRQLATDDVNSITQDNLEVVAAWDAEQVFKRLHVWNEDSDGLTLAPFGPKPHSLGMALFAIKNDCGMYYTQPKSYHPHYSKGRGNLWAYIVKWDGVPCYDRMSDA